MEKTVPYGRRGDEEDRMHGEMEDDGNIDVVEYDCQGVKCVLVEIFRCSASSFRIHTHRYKT